METSLIKLEQKLATLKTEEAEILKQIESERNKNKPKLIRDLVNGYDDICTHLNVPLDDSDMQISIGGFNEDEIIVMKYLAKMMRISKVYNQGWLPKIGERRYYAWGYLSPSGFVFTNTDYVAALTTTASASRLCFRTP